MLIGGNFEKYDESSYSLLIQLFGLSNEFIYR